MEDKEIWKTYEEVRETYAQNYEEEQKKNLQNNFALGTGGSVFCTRDSMRLDTVDSKNVMVDSSSDEVNKLFEKEVTARYK